MGAFFTDSGSSLKIDKRNSKGEYTCQMFVIGVTSEGSAACGLSNSYGVYTTVSKFLDSIEQNVWPNKNQKVQNVQFNSSYRTMTEETVWVWGNKLFLKIQNNSQYGFLITDAVNLYSLLVFKKTASYIQCIQFIRIKIMRIYE